MSSSRHRRARPDFEATESTPESINPLTPGDSPEDESYEEVPEQPRKRTRVRADTTGPNDDTFETLDLDGIDASTQLAYGESIKNAALSADATRQEGFRPGSVIALGLKNFQVSSCIAWRFCARLNLIIGSNGSGKSTVITALYLLFQGRLDSLQRKGYAAFVQAGSEQAEITAVIQGKQGEEHNPIVQMVIESSHARKRETQPLLYVDHRRVTKSEMLNFIATYNIQVNNLCQFLPQTRVAAFSGEPREQRLISTETAVGYDGMVDHHEFLKEAGGRLNNVLAAHAELVRQIEIEEESRAKFKKILERLDASERKKADHRYHELMIPVIRYKDAKAYAEQLELELKEAKRRLREVSPELQEVIDAKKESEGILESLMSSINHLRSVHASSISELQTLNEGYNQDLTRIANLQSRYENSEEELQQVMDSIERYEKDQRRIKMEIASYASEKIPDIELARLREQYNAIEANIQRLEAKASGLRNEISVTTSERRRSERRAEQLRAEVANLQREERSRDSSKLPGLFDNREIGANLARTVNFVRNLIADGRLQDKVHMPPLLSVTIIDKRILEQLERKVSMRALRTFVCESKEDLGLLSRLSREKGLDLIVSMYDPRVKRPVPSFSPADLKEFGFEGHLLDVLNGPRPVLDMLANTANLGTTPYSLKELSLSSKEKIANSGYLGSYSDTKNFYDVSRSRYGRRQQIVQRMALSRQPAKWAEFMLQRSTRDEQNRLNLLATEVEASAEASRAKCAEAQASCDEIEREVNDAQEESRPLKTQIRNAENINNTLERFESDLESLTARRQRALTKAEGVRQDIKRYRQEEISETSALDATALVNKLDIVQRTENSLLEHNWRAATFRGFASRLEYVITKERKHLQEAIDSLRSKLAIANETSEDERHAHRKAIAELRVMGREGDAKEAVKILSLDDATRRVSELRAEINLNKTGENYEETKELLEQTEALLQDLKVRKDREAKKLQTSNSEVAKVRKEWERELDRLVGIVNAKYAEMFNQLGCQGNVVLIKDGTNFGDWGIDIEVSFRTGEPPKPLNRQRQSGGERAVATAVYLLALQDLAKAPFRVVDEINQGMDEENERRTHQFIVSQACGTGSQYFLVTPKLLWDLPYHSMQDVSVIFSSPLIAPGTISPPNNADQIVELYKAESQLAQD